MIGGTSLVDTLKVSLTQNSLTSWVNQPSMKKTVVMVKLTKSGLSSTTEMFTPSTIGKLTTPTTQRPNSRSGTLGKTNAADFINELTKKLEKNRENYFVF